MLGHGDPNKTGLGITNMWYQDNTTYMLNKNIVITYIFTLIIIR